MLDAGYERYDAIWMKVVGTRRLGRKCTASQFEPLSVWGSALMMMVVEVCVIFIHIILSPFIIISGFHFSRKALFKIK